MNDQRPNLDPHPDPTRKHDFVFLFDVRDGNPNGDPDAGGMPRIDPVTMQGIVTDVAIKRKLRNAVTLISEGRPGYEIYVEEGVALNAQHERAYTDGSATTERDAKTWMQENFFDVRMFGAVMTTGNQDRKAGRARGPIQLTFSRSIDPVTPLEAAITRVTKTRQDAIDAGKETEMGSKHYIPYGLYRGEGYFSAPIATKAGVTTEDLQTFWRAFTLMFEHDRASGRGAMALRGLYVFTHDDAYGKAPAHKLLERIQVRPLSHREARNFAEYTVTVDESPLPDGVTLTPVVL